MDDKTPELNERIASRRLLGVDTDGNKHRFDMIRQTVYVLLPDETAVIHAEHIGERPLGDWVDFVGRECGGWTTLHYSTSPLTRLADAVTTAERA